MKVLVIGGAGYIGSHVVKELMSKGHRITVFDNLSTGLIQNLFKENDFIAGDIMHKDDLEKAFSREFDAFIHLAAWKAVGESMEYPEKYSENNITGTLNIINTAICHNCKKMIFSSTAAVYGSPNYLPVDEKHPTNPENFYGFTKLEIERFIAWYSQLKGLNYAVLRYFNAAGYDPEGILYGLEKKPSNLLPVIMETAAGIRKKMSVFGTDWNTRDGTCIRDYIHVSDLASAHAMALDYISEEKQNLTINLGTGNGITVKEMLETAERITGKRINAEFVSRRAGDPAVVTASADKAKELLGWEAKYSNVDTLVSSTWNAYKRFFNIK